MPVISIEQAQDVKGVHVLVRASLNVPIVGGVVANPFRLEAAMKTINFLRARGARTVLLSHIDGELGASLAPVAAYLKQHTPLTFVDDIVGPTARDAVKNMKDGDVVMLQNVRRDAGEQKNDEQFARALAAMGDIFVNDDFAAAHRVHASIVGVPKYLPSYAGLQFMAEVAGLTPALTPKSPSLAIVGGAKFVTKEPLIKKLLATYDHVAIAGALANDFLKAKGYEVGRSLISDSPHIKDLLQNSKLLLPTDVSVMGVDGIDIKLPNEVLGSEVIYDVGPLTLAAWATYISKANTILWNGPLGAFELGFKQMSETLARMIAATNSQSIVGGGDTIAAIRRLNIEKKFTFTSTAGGAMLDFLANGTLPGIVALEQSKKLV